MTTTLSLAVCLFPGVTILDFVGPMELLGFISPKALTSRSMPAPVAYAIEPVYFSVSKEPVENQVGVALLPTRTYEEVKLEEQFDVLLIPGGTKFRLSFQSPNNSTFIGVGTRPEICPKSLLDFIKRQAPNAKYVLSVCTGSEVLAQAGMLEGKRATTNKSSFNRIKEYTVKQHQIEWVPKARWVVDGRFWTSSGVTAGADMAYAFLVQLVGQDLANFVRGIVELSIHKEDDDEFAEFYGLV
ncbi:hypothetical protein PHLCEN_2v116 [Hermanssonia centrifuga]|uniref:DJ-1/PfpI domain-containing protein n=1 Tax=Hermanssonia centrifuga TaxID=98765 RepID=A0A2R6S6V2_9APHY|nr:hypothetical protein PHLCEN_2v116 [Hermanssonia centrifuga]